MAKETEIDKQGAKRDQYRLEQLKSKILNWIFGIVSFLIVVLIYMMINGDKYRDILNAIGLGYFEERGVYADCSRPENRNSPFCQRRESKADKEWTDLSKGKAGRSQFSITDR